MRSFVLPGIALGLTTILTASCGTGASNVVLTNVCPFVVEYTQAEQVQVADDLKVLPDGSPVREWIKDYGVMRNESRACSGGS